MASYKGHTAKIILGLIVMLTLISMVSASLITTHSYTDEDLKVEFRTLGLVKFGEATLTSHNSINEVKQVPYGSEEVVMYYDFNFDEKQVGGLGEVEIYNMNDGGRKEIKDYSYVIWDMIPYQSAIYEDVCSTKGNLTCTKEIKGYETKYREGWVDYLSNDVPTSGRIGVKVMVNKGDHYDGVWNIVDEKITEHAEWTAGLNVNLVSYWNFEETVSEGKLVDNVRGKHNGTLMNTPTNVTGQIGDALQFDGSNQWINFTADNTDFDMSATDTMSISVWIKHDGTVQSYPTIWGYQTPGGGSGRALATYAGTNNIATFSQGGGWDDSSDDVGTGWRHVVWVVDGGSSTIYMDNVSVLGPSASVTWSSGTVHGIAYMGENSFWDGIIDEVAIWNRTISTSEINDLWNDGNGITIPVSSDDTPVVTLVVPADGNTTQNPVVNFNCNATDDLGIVNLTLIIDGVDNLTVSNTTSGEDLTINESYNMAEGTYTWTCRGTDETNQAITPSTRSLEVHLTPPTLNLNAPTGNKLLSAGDNLTLTWGITETGENLTSHISNCSVQYGDTLTELANPSVCLETNSTLIAYVVGQETVQFNVKDEFDFVTSSNVSIDVQATVNSITFTSPITTASSTSFILNLSADGSESITANLIHNGTSRVSSKVGDDTEMTFSNTFSPTEVGENEFYWEVTVGSNIYNTSRNNQTVTDFNITGCNPGDSVIFNFTVRDEDTQAELNEAVENITVEIDLQATSLSGVSIFNYSASRPLENPVAVCTGTTLSDDIIILNGIVRYDSNETYISEFYTIQNYSLTNTSLYNNISLYDLTTANAQEFKVTYKDTSFLPVIGAVLDVQRRYIGDGVFRTVELPPFDNQGETLANFVLGDVIYTLVVKKDNQVLATFNNIKAFCDNVATGNCEINLNALSSIISSESYQTSNGVSLTMGFNETSREVVTSFSVVDGTSKTLVLNVTTTDLNGAAVVCSDTLTSSSGTISCIVPTTIGNATGRASLIVNGKKSAFLDFSFIPRGDDVYGFSTATLSVVSFLTVVGTALSATPAGVIIAVMFGIAVNIALLLISGTFIGAGSVFIWVVAMCVTLLWKLNRRQD